jgi:sialic acid synthase SpsE
VIEKHFTLDRELPGPDQRASIEPGELALLVRGVREVERALGDGRKRPVAAELDTRDVARRSLVAARDLPAGQRLAPCDLRAKRPASGLPPTALDRVTGRQLRVALRADEPLREEHLL